MSTFRDVELVRLQNAVGEDEPTQEQERSAASVFPTESKKMKKVDEATVAAALGGKATRFVSEAQLEENKALHGERLEDGTFSGRSLTEAIIMQREAKQQKFDEAWKQMKQGKNRPLEADEVEFLDALMEQEAARDREARQAEAAALSSFRAAQAGASTSDRSNAALDHETKQTPAALRPALPIQKKAKLAVKVVKKEVTKAGPSPGKPAGLLSALGAYDSDSDDPEDDSSKG